MASLMQEAYNQMYQEPLDEIAAYQPPPQIQQPPAQVRPAQQSQRAQQQATKFRMDPNASRAKFDTTNLAGRMGMKTQGDIASVTLDDYTEG